MRSVPIRFLCSVVAVLGSSLFAAGTGKLTVAWLDMTAHGLAVVMETPAGRVYLIDTGGTKSAGKAGEPDYNAGRDIVDNRYTGRGQTDGYLKIRTTAQQTAGVLSAQSGRGGEGRRTARRGEAARRQLPRRARG